MSFSGGLEDVQIADLLQFVQMGRRTGTLLLKRKGELAEIAFHQGSIVNARCAGATRKLGELLVERGALTPGALEDALHVQTTQVPRPSLGQVLIESGAVEAETMYAAVRQQFSEVIRRVIDWREGAFEFVLDEVRPADELAVQPGDLVPQVHLDTQSVLLDALRALDEERRDAPPSAPAPRALAPVLAAATPRPPQPPLVGRVQVVTRDDALQPSLQAELGERASVVRVPLREAGLPAPGEQPPLVVLDLRANALPLDAVGALRRSRPRARLVVVSNGDVAAVDAYASGAIACVPPEVLFACVRSLLPMREDAPVADHARRDLAKLRRVLGDLHSGLITTSISLSLMNVISESVERAVLFLVARESLVALGAFGTGVGGRPLAQLSQGLRLPAGAKDILGACLGDGRARRAQSNGARLPERLLAILGRPRSGQLAVLPVLGGQRVVALVYVDNGSRTGPLRELELLELASAQAGLAFENELLRRQMARAS